MDGMKKGYFYSLDISMVVNDETKINAALDEFFNMLTDPNVSEDEFYMRWMSSGSNTGFFYKAMEGDSVWNFAHSPVEPFIENDNMTYELSVVITDTTTNESFTEKFVVRVMEYNGMTYIDFNYVNPPITGSNEYFDLLYALSMYYMDYSDPNLTNEELNSMYFNNMASQEYLTQRQLDLDNGVMIDLIDIALRGNDDPETTTVRAVISVTFQNADGTFSSARTTVEPVRVAKRIDAATPLLTILDPDDDDDGIPTADKLAALDKYMFEFNRQSIAAKDLCMMLVPTYRVEYCEMEKTLMLQDGYMIDDIEYYVDQDGNEFIRIRKRPDLLTQEWDALIDEHMVLFSRDENGNVLLDLIWDYNFSYEEELRKGYDAYLAKANNASLSTDEVCIDFDTSSDNYCPMIRQKILDNNATAVATEFYMMDGQYILVIQYEGTDVPLEPDMVVVSFRYDEVLMRSVLVINPYTQDPM
jgi:hypothetical protein